MKKKIAVRKHDKRRVLLTEVLPYELPIIFTNAFFYEYAKRESKCPALVDHLIQYGKTSNTIPFEYSIRQGKAKERVLSLIHPGRQLAFVDFYADSYSQILWLCKRSSFSLRYPAKRVTYFEDAEYIAEDDALKRDVVDVEMDAVLNASHASSYFSYLKYSRLHKFIDSPEFIDLEVRYPCLLKFDISKCFPSVYTHTISWAIRGKTFSKKHKTAYTFEATFDGLMQGSNYGETNGIVVGPEVSRIFAEIILQSADLSIDRRLKEASLDVVVRRYIDDYYVFGKTKDDLDEALRIAIEELLPFRFHVNESKTERYERPFASPQTIAKADIKQLFEASLLKWLTELRLILKKDPAVSDPKLWIPIRRGKAGSDPSNALITALKILVKRGGVTFDVICGYAFGTLTKELYRASRGVEAAVSPAEGDRIGLVLTNMLDVAYFLYAMDMRVNNTYSLSQLMLLSMKVARVSAAVEGIVRQKIVELSRLVFSAHKDRNVRSEMGNLLIATKAVAPGELLSTRELKEILGPKKKGTKSVDWSYFDVVTLLHYVEGSPAHEDLREEVRQVILERFEKDEEVRNSSELTHLFFDVLGCPHLAADFKRQVARIVYRKIMRVEGKVNEINEILNFVSKERLQFVIWSSGFELEYLLKKKKLTAGY